MLSEALVQERIEELNHQRDELVKDANLQVAAINGAIAALSALLVVEEEAEEAE
jgi:hypothetical protein